MKHTKRIASLLMVVALLMIMSISAFAEDVKGSITLDNPTEGTTYTAYKIFDTVYNSDKSSYDYTIQEDSEWYDVVKDFDGLTLTKAPGTEKTYVVSIGEGFSAAQFSKLLKENTDGKNSFPLSPSDDVVKAENLDLGYYFVDNNTGALLNLTTTNPDAVIHDKNDVPFTKEVSDNADTQGAQIGQVLTYTIKGTVPDTTGFKSYLYMIRDTMSDGLTYLDDTDNPPVLKINGIEVDFKTVEGFDYEKRDNGFKLIIPVMDYQEFVNSEIEFAYKARVNEDALEVISENNATLRYSNNPDNVYDPENDDPEGPDDPDNPKFDDPDPVIVKTFTSRLNISKYESGNTDKKLEGAKFVLENKEGKFYKYDAEAKEVMWVIRSEADEMTTTADGAAEFIGLKHGDYYLVEVEAPAGYNLLTNKVNVTINGQDENVESLTVTSSVANSIGSMLPSTGGIGTMIFYISGSILLISAAVALFFVVRKRVK